MSDCLETFKVSLHEGPKGSPNLVFSWTVSRKTREDLLSLKVEKPYLLALATRPQLDQELFDAWDFYPLHKGVGCLQLAIPGEYKVFFLVVYDLCYYGPDGPSVFRNVYDYFRLITGSPTFRNLPRLEHIEEVTVQVSPEYFLAKPGAFGWWWSNYWFRTTPTDRCSYRQRLWLVTVPQAIYLLGFVLVRAVMCLSVALVLILIANRPKVSPIWHPFSQKVSQVSEGFKFKWSFRLPIVWLGLGEVVYLLSIVPWSKALVLSVIGSLAIALGIASLAVAVYKTIRCSLSNPLQRYYTRMAKIEGPIHNSCALKSLRHKQRTCLPYKEWTP